MQSKLKMLEGVILHADHDTSGGGVSKVTVSSCSRRTYLVQDDQRIHLNMLTEAMDRTGSRYGDPIEPAYGSLPELLT